MRKKLTIAAALAAFMAFAMLPAVASASPELTYPTGTRMTTPTKLRAHNVGEIRFTTSAGSIICTTGHMTGNLVLNNGSQFESDIESASFTSEEGGPCTGVFGAATFSMASLPWCMRSTQTTDGFEIRGGGCNETGRSFTLVILMSGLECWYVRSSVTGTFTTHPEDAKVTVSENELAKAFGSFLCPGSGKLDMTFTLEHDSAGTQPIYIS